MDVGALRRGTGTFKVRTPKVSEGSSDVIVRESTDELTLRAEEVRTSKALKNVNYMEQERWGPPLVDADWYAFCQALYKGIEGEDWEGMYESYKEVSRALSWSSTRIRRVCRNTLMSEAYALSNAVEHVLRTRSYHLRHERTAQHSSMGRDGLCSNGTRLVRSL